MDNSWHIPRPSLSGSTSSPSSNNSNKSVPMPSTVSRNFLATDHFSKKKILSLEHLDRTRDGHGSVCNSTKYDDSYLNTSHRYNSNVHPKRGSRSSQGSNDSTSSAYSVSSGSLLLTAANLERFAEIHRQQNKSYMDSKNELLKSNYNSNLMLVSNQSNLGKDVVISIKPNLYINKTKDTDAISVASSTHFTMVNGEIGSSRQIPGGMCSRGKQVTVLIVSMSLFFLFIILGMVYALEMRAREMPKS